jgi:aryl-alcohol dehydrogenase-like predicted oxidoreductase
MRDWALAAPPSPASPVPPCGQKQQRGPDAAITGTQQAARLIGQAMDAGINLFDTASYMDGAAESMLASALGKRRAEVLISSRLGSRPSTTHRHPGLSRSDITWSLEQSLQRLGSDWIDLCVVPHEDPHTPLEETLQTLDEMVRAGKGAFWVCQLAGLEGRAGAGIAKGQWLDPFCFGEMHYSLSGRGMEREPCPCCKAMAWG